MDPGLLLKISSVLMFIHFAGHMFGHLTWKKSEDAEKTQLIHQMTTFKFKLMGPQRSFTNLLDGYGYIAAFALLLTSILLWILSGTTVGTLSAVKMLAGAIALFLFALGIDELLFFFPFAAAFSLMAAILTVIAILQM